MPIRKSVTFAISLVCLAALTACSNDDGSSPPLVLGDGPSNAGSSVASPSVTPETSETTGTPTRFDKKGHEVVPGKLSTQGAAEEAVAEAWLAYWRVRLDAFNAAELDPSALGEVAADDAADDVIAYVGYLQEKGLHTEGDLLMDVDRVKVNGEQAELRSCATNKTVDRTKDGSAAEPVNPFYVFLGQLRRQAGQWRVDDVAIASRTAC